jgi:hypothetical protein
VIDAYLAQHNLRAKRYVCRTDGAEGQRKINRAWAVAVADRSFAIAYDDPQCAT